MSESDEVTRRLCARLHNAASPEVNLPPFVRDELRSAADTIERLVADNERLRTKLMMQDAGYDTCDHKARAEAAEAQVAALTKALQIIAEMKTDSEVEIERAEAAPGEFYPGFTDWEGIPVIARKALDGVGK